MSGGYCRSGAGGVYKSSTPGASGSTFPKQEQDARLATRTVHPFSVLRSRRDDAVEVERVELRADHASGFLFGVSRKMAE